MVFEFKKYETISDIVIIQPKVFGDERGFFLETYNKKDFDENGIENIFVQDSHSKSIKGTFRGFHFQTQNVQAKLVRVIKGAVLDIAIDIRKQSQTYGKFITEVLSGENKKQLFIPKGFAHGFLALEDGTEFVYKCDDIYNVKGEGGIIYDDIDINIDWDGIMKKYDIKELVLADKDKKHPTLKEFYPANPF